MKVLTSEEQTAFMNTVISDKMGVAFITSLGTGLRIGELLALRWQDIDLENGLLKVNQTLARLKDPNNPEAPSRLVFSTPKTEHSKRSIPLLLDIIKLLKEHKKEQAAERLQAGGLYEGMELVFCNEYGKPLAHATVTQRFKRLLKEAGIKDINLHALRHAFATRGLENGIELKVMQELLGHSTINMTANIYSHVLPEKKQEAINKLQGIFNNSKIVLSHWNNIWWLIVYIKFLTAKNHLLQRRSGFLSDTTIGYICTLIIAYAKVLSIKTYYIQLFLYLLIIGLNEQYLLSPYQLGLC